MHLWDELPVEFGQSVTYQCAKSSLYFEHDYNLKQFQLECLDDGSFDVPDDDEWFHCVSSKTYYDELNFIEFLHSMISLLQLYFALHLQRNHMVESGDGAKMQPLEQELSKFCNINYMAMSHVMIAV